MVKNSGQKNRAKRYAAEHDTTYQQARETLNAQHTQDILNAFVAECESSPNTPADWAGNLPFGKNEDGIMQWVLPTRADEGWEPAIYFEPLWEPGTASTIEVVGGTGTGKTTLLSRMIAHWATEKPTPRSVLLYAGEREFAPACARWKEWPQVVVIGPDGQVGGSSGNVREGESPEARGGGEDEWALRVFDDWFADKEGLVPRYTRDEISRLPESHPVRWRARVAGTASVAAFRPGQTSHLDETEEIREAFAQAEGEVFSRGFVARDEFVFLDEESGVVDAWPASMVIVPDGFARYVWESRLDGRRLGLPVTISAGPGRLMYADEPTEFTEHTSPKKVSDFAYLMWYKRSDHTVDVDFPFVSGPRNRDVEQVEGMHFHAFPSLDVFPTDGDNSSEFVVKALADSALSAYWAVGKRGSLGDGE